MTAHSIFKLEPALKFPSTCIRLSFIKVDKAFQVIQSYFMMKTLLLQSKPVFFQMLCHLNYTPTVILTALQINKTQ